MKISALNQVNSFMSKNKVSATNQTHSNNSIKTNLSIPLPYKNHNITSFKGNVAVLGYNCTPDDMYNWIIEQRKTIITTKDKYQNTVLHKAAQNDNPEVLKLIMAEIKRNGILEEAFQTKNSQGCTAVHCAAREGRTENLKQIIDAFKDRPETLQKLLTEQTNNGLNAFSIAAYNGHNEVLKIMLDLFKSNPEKLKEAAKAKSDYGTTIQVCISDPYTFDTMLNVFDDNEELKHALTQQDKDGLTALNIAVDCNNKESFAKVLSLFGNDLDGLQKFLSLTINSMNIMYISEFDGNNILHDICRRNRTGFIPIIFEALKDEPERFSELLKQQDTRYGNTPLHYAVLFGNNDVIKEILKTGVNKEILQITNNRCDTPLRLAKSKSSETFNTILSLI